MGETDTDIDVEIKSGVCPYCGRHGTSYWNEIIPELLLYVHESESRKEPRQQRRGRTQGREKKDHTMDACEVII